MNAIIRTPKIADVLYQDNRITILTKYPIKPTTSLMSADSSKNSTK